MPVTPLGTAGRALLEQVPEADFELALERDGRPLAGTPLAVQVGGWEGRVDWVLGGLVAGRARNLRHPDRDVTVVAFDSAGARAFATARAGQDHRFVMALPPLPAGGPPLPLGLGIAGSDLLLAGGQILAGAAPPPPVRPRADRPLIRIKVSTPNLREAPMWGDFHFAHALRAALERLGWPAAVDTADGWYAQPRHEDVVLVLRGLQPVELDPGKINLMWLISHPDRVTERELAGYDHVAVASDIHAAELRRQLDRVEVLHQASDTALFAPQPDRPRLPACLFVGNSRRQYRTMVRWCVQRQIPLELYGGGWEGVLPPGLLCAPAIANEALADSYAGHLILLNDHWDEMRRRGFLSNRLFDGSATATPIVTDAVAGLEAVFGDTIAVATDIDAFTRLVRDGLSDPGPWLERAGRARAIVAAAHTFDHRARQIADLVERLAVLKGR